MGMVEVEARSQEAEVEGEVQSQGAEVEVEVEVQSLGAEVEEEVQPQGEEVEWAVQSQGVVSSNIERGLTMGLMMEIEQAEFLRLVKLRFVKTMKIHHLSSFGIELTGHSSSRMQDSASLGYLGYFWMFCCLLGSDA